MQLPADRDLELGLYSADDFLRYDLTDELLDYLANAFDVLEVIGLNRRRLRVDQADEGLDPHDRGSPAELMSAFKLALKKNGDPSPYRSRCIGAMCPIFSQ